MTAPDPVPYRPQAANPKSLADMRPTDYLIHLKPWRCSNCLSTGESFEIFLVRSLGKKRRLTPVTDTEINQTLPIGASRLQLKLVPFCPSCYRSIDNASLPAVDEAKWLEAARRCEEHAVKTRKQPARREPPPPSLDDLPDL